MSYEELIIGELLCFLLIYLVYGSCTYKYRNANQLATAHLLMTRVSRGDSNYCDA